MKHKTNCEDNVQSSFNVEEGGTYSNHRISCMPTNEHRDSIYLEQILRERGRSDHCLSRPACNLSPSHTRWMHLGLT